MSMFANMLRNLKGVPFTRETLIPLIRDPSKHDPGYGSMLVLKIHLVLMSRNETSSKYYLDRMETGHLENCSVTLLFTGKDPKH